jgi:hypothetical protein
MNTTRPGRSRQSMHLASIFNNFPSLCLFLSSTLPFWETDVTGQLTLLAKVGDNASEVDTVGYLR